LTIGIEQARLFPPRFIDMLNNGADTIGMASDGPHDILCGHGTVVQAVVLIGQLAGMVSFSCLSTSPPLYDCTEKTAICQAGRSISLPLAWKIWAVF